MALSYSDNNKCNCSQGVPVSPPHTLYLLFVISIMFFSFLTSALFTKTARAEKIGSRVRIGVLTLYKPQHIIITFKRYGKPVIPVINGEPLRDSPVGPDGTIEVAADSAGYLRVLGRDSGNDIFSKSQVHNLRFAPSSITNAPFDFEITIPGKVIRKYYGSLEIKFRKNGTILPVITKNLEDYIAMVVASEIKGFKEKEVIKAQAIVSRSYITAHGARHRKEDFDFCDTTHCQLFRGHSVWEETGRAQTAKIKSLIRETKGKVIYRNGKPVVTYYTAACSGYTATPDIIWGGSVDHNLVQVRDPFHKSGTKYFPWIRKIKRRNVINAAGWKLGVTLSRDARIYVSSRSELGDYTQEVTVEDKGKVYTIQGDKFRRAVSRSFGWNLILSNSYDIIREDDYIIFKGRGFGHGIGFCQYGAREMAKLGKSYTEIIQYYFPSSQIVDRY